jgi:hypothetical protein
LQRRLNTVNVGDGITNELSIQKHSRNYLCFNSRPKESPNISDLESLLGIGARHLSSRSLNLRPVEGIGMKSIGSPNVGLRIELDSTGAAARSLTRLDGISGGTDGTGREGDEGCGRNLHGELLFDS